MKTSSRLSVWVAAVLAAAAMVLPASSPARNRDVILFVAPARYTVIQVMMDVLRRREAILVSYQGEPGDAEPLLHAWNGREWVYVAFDDYRTAHFLRVRPTRVVLIGDRTVLPESLVTGAADWAPALLNVDDMAPSALINAAGQLLRFDSSDWAWFASRYRMEIIDQAAPRRAQSWYDEPFVESEPPESPWQILRRRWSGSKQTPRPPREGPETGAPVPPVADSVPVSMPPLPAVEREEKAPKSADTEAGIK